jgi:hypothetical protein
LRDHRGGLGELRLALSEVVRRLVGAGVAIDAIGPWTPTLEEVFVDLVEESEAAPAAGRAA